MLKKATNFKLFIDKQIQDEQTYEKEMLENYASLDVIKSKKAQVNTKKQKHHKN